MSRDITPFALRMPPEMRAKVEHAAKESRRSLNAEILARLEASFQTPVTMIVVDEHHRAEQPAERALEMVEKLRGEILAILARPKE